MTRTLFSAVAGSALLLSGCGGDAETEEGVTAEERRNLDNAAAMLDDQAVVDTSADSLVVEENAANRILPAPAEVENEARPVIDPPQPPAGNAVAPPQ